jgi:hypothetical protein
MIIKNLLPSSYETEIENALLGNNFPWYHYDITSDLVSPHTKVNSSTKDCHQFSHMFFSDRITSEYYRLIFPIIILLEKETGRKFSDRIIRIKANYLSREADYPESFHNIPHCDGYNVETLIYYVNDSDGNTILFNEKPNDVVENKLTIKEVVSPQRGNCLLFDSEYLHASSPPKTNKNRVVINMVFEKRN